MFNMQKKPLIALSIVLVFAILLIVFNSSPVVKLFSSAVQSVFSVPKSIIYSLNTGNNPDDPTLSRLKKENDNLTRKLIDFERTKRDNEALKSQFETAETSSFKLIPARVIGTLGGLSSPISLITDHGSNQKIEPGMGVVSGNNLVGKVGKVGQNYSEVLLATNNSFTTLARTVTNGATGVARGQESFIVLDRVENIRQIEKGEILVTSGELNSSGIGIPNDLIVGKITSVNKIPSAVFQTAKIEPAINFAKLGTVFIVLSF